MEPRGRERHRLAFIDQPAGAKAVGTAESIPLGGSMKSEMRRSLAHQPFEEKIRKVGQLTKLSATVRAQRIREDAHDPRSGFRNPPAMELPPKK